jgi:hypothetical protein
MGSTGLALFRVVDVCAGESGRRQYPEH